MAPLNIPMVRATIRLTYSQKDAAGQVTITTDKGAKPAFNIIGYFTAGVKNFPDLDVEIPPATKGGELQIWEQALLKGMVGFSIIINKEEWAPGKFFPASVTLAFYNGKPDPSNIIAAMTTKSKSEGPLETLPQINATGYSQWT